MSMIPLTETRKERATTILISAKDLISDPAKWTQNAPARDEKGKEVPAVSESATCWCTIGALHKVSEGEGYMRFSDAYKALCDSSPSGMVAHYNDEGTHADVMALFDRAIVKIANS
jgi:hypothetical protein